MLKFTTNIWVHKQGIVDYEKLLNMQVVRNDQFNALALEFGRFRDKLKWITLEKIWTTIHYSLNTA